jgi:copper chaperone CopZ
MKTTTLLLAATLAAVTSSASARSIVIEVDGLVCAFCAQGIEKKMKAQAATRAVFVSLESRLVAVELKDGQDIADATLKSEITDAGYVVRSIRRGEETVETIRARVKAAKAKS